METLRGFKHFRSDPEWLGKLFVMSVLLLIPVAGQIIVIGWAALFLRGIIRGRPGEWTPPLRFDFDYLLKLADTGFKTWMVQLAWTLPMMFVVMTLFGCAGGLTAFLTGVAAQAHHGGGGAGPAGVMPWVVPVLYLVMVPVLIAVQIPTMYAVTRVELTNDIKDGFAFREVLKMARMMFKETLIGTLVITIVSIPIVLLGELACFVGIFVSMWVLFFIRTHFQAQLYQRYVEKGGAPLDIASDEIAMLAAVAAPAT